MNVENLYIYGIGLFILLYYCNCWQVGSSLLRTDAVYEPQYEAEIGLHDFHAQLSGLTTVTP